MSAADSATRSPEGGSVLFGAAPRGNGVYLTERGWAQIEREPAGKRGGTGFPAGMGEMNSRSWLFRPVLELLLISASVQPAFLVVETAQPKTRRARRTRSFSLHLRPASRRAPRFRSSSSPHQRSADSLSKRQSPSGVQAVGRRARKTGHGRVRRLAWRRGRPGSGGRRGRSA